jgi:hypothetical protein
MILGPGWACGQVGKGEGRPGAMRVGPHWSYRLLRQPGGNGFGLLGPPRPKNQSL